MTLAQDDLKPLNPTDWGSDGGMTDHYVGPLDYIEPVPADLVKQQQAGQTAGGLFGNVNMGQVLAIGGISLVVGLMLRKMR